MQYREHAGISNFKLAPSPSTVTNWAAYREIIERNYPQHRDGHRPSSAFSVLPDLIQQWKVARWTDIYARMKIGGVTPLQEPIEGLEVERLLCLATSAFVCHHNCRGACPVYHIDDNLGLHSCLREEPAWKGWQRGWNFDDMTFSLDANEVIASCVKTVGLDPRVATVDDMDNLNPRFYCSNCPMGAKLARSWRGCVRNPLREKFLHVELICCVTPRHCTYGSIPKDKDGFVYPEKIPWLSSSWRTRALVECHDLDVEGRCRY